MAMDETTQLALTPGRHSFPGRNSYTFTRIGDGEDVFLIVSDNVPVKMQPDREYDVGDDKGGEHTIVCTESCRVTVHRVEPEDATAGTGPAVVEEKPADAPVSSGGVVLKPFADAETEARA